MLQIRHKLGQAAHGSLVYLSLWANISHHSRSQNAVHPFAWAHLRDERQCGHQDEPGYGSADLEGTVMPFTSRLMLSQAAHALPGCCRPACVLDTRSCIMLCCQQVYNLVLIPDCLGAYHEMQVLLRTYQVHM